jgi:hypothetical protein
MTVKAPVQPVYGSGQTLTPAAASATVAIPRGNKQEIVTNLGLNVGYFRIGKAGLGSATIADYPVPPGAQVVVTRSEDDDQMSHMSPLGTTFHIMNGEGF